METRSLLTVSGIVNPDNIRIGRECLDFPLVEIGFGFDFLYSHGDTVIHNLWRFAGASGLITGADNQRNDQFVIAVYTGNRLIVNQCDFDRQSRHEVGNMLSEHVGPVLDQQRSRLALLFGFVKFFLGFSNFMDLGLYDFVAHLHGHGVDRRILVQGKQVSGIQAEPRSDSQTFA